MTTPAEPAIAARWWQRLWIVSSRASSAIAIAVAAAYAFMVPMAFWAGTRSSLALPLLLSVIAPLAALQIGRATAKGKLRVLLAIVAFAASAAFGVSVLVGLVITPFSAYSLWFEAMSTGGTGTGTVSNLLTLLSVFFSTTLGASFITMGFAWPALVSLLVVSALVSVMLQGPLFYALTVATGFLCVFYLLMRHGRGFLGRRIGYAGGFFAIVLTISAFSAGDRQAQGSRFIDSTVHPNLRQTVSSALPQFPLLYGIPGYGISFDERSLGGKAVLSPLPIFAVEADAAGPLYLKTDVFDFYDGENWRSTIDSSAPRIEHSTPLLRGRPRRGTESVRVEILLDFYQKLPYTLDTSAFFFERRDAPAVLTASQERGFFLEKPLVAGDVLHIGRGTAKPVLPSSHAQLSEEDRERYLQLPRSLSRTVTKIGEAFANPQLSDHELLAVIDDHLSGTCTYSLNVENLRRSEDFMEKFLVGERKGYCVHFATAFVTFARMHDIPARYNSGFLVNFPFGQNLTQVTGLSAHSWAEVWLEDEGWMRWEATPAVEPSQYQFLGIDDPALEALMMEIYGFEMDFDDATMRQVQSILGNVTVSVPEQELAIQAVSDAATRRGWRVVVMAAAGVVAAVLLAAVLRRRLRWWRLPPARRRVVQAAYRLARAGRWFGAEDPRSGGWQAWRDHMVARLNRRRRRDGRAASGSRTGQTASAAARQLQMALYAGHPLRPRDLRFMRAALRRLWRYRLIGI